MTWDEWLIVGLVAFLGCVWIGELFMYWRNRWLKP
jgi:hypothetical protein